MVLIFSPFMTNPNKYRNEYTASCNYRPSSTYLSHFDDIVNSGWRARVECCARNGGTLEDFTGAFSSALYSTSRLIERSRSRTRERRQAMRSQRSASNYYRWFCCGQTRERHGPPLMNVSAKAYQCVTWPTHVTHTLVVLSQTDAAVSNRRWPELSGMSILDST